MVFYRRDAALEDAGRSLIASALRQFGPTGLEPDSIALTLVVPGLTDAIPRGFGHRGDCPIYPASVIKLFYLVAAQGWLEAGRLRPSAELDRALAAMIRESSNDATNHLVDLLTGTTSGPELSPAALARWLARRRAVNRYFARWKWPEFAAINATQKTWDEGPYGREHQSRFTVENNRNRLTTDATARLLGAINAGEAVSPAHSAAMRALLARDLDPAVWRDCPEAQVGGFLGEGLPDGARLWSKAGWTSETRQDAALIELPGGRSFTLVVFTEGRSLAQNERLLPFLAREAAEAVGTL
ncbi:serine hydrolase [Rhodospirillaceae bacterium SYSU D60014]|uniref:serine hydrolase n=1 Tax=Virgifigura deserti TaxID=2268457 RepID=UPI000E66B6B9